MYMRHIEPWLDAAGWGRMWPSLRDREPGPPPQEGRNTRPTTSTPIHRQSNEGGDDNGGEDSEDSDTSEPEDDEGDDPEQPEDDELDESDEETNNSKNTSKNTCPIDGESEDEAEWHNL
jgi:hypothetical protein